MKLTNVQELRAINEQYLLNTVVGINQRQSIKFE